MEDQPARVDALQAAVEGRRVDLDLLLVLVQQEAALAVGARRVRCLEHVGEEACAEHLPRAKGGHRPGSRWVGGECRVTRAAADQRAPRAGAPSVWPRSDAPL